MRQVFSSPRLENVEAVAKLLSDAGIEVRISDGRSYKGNRRGTFSYNDDNAPRPAVWVVRSDDQVRARELLRAANLIDSTRSTDSYLAPTFRSEQERYGKTPAQKRVQRVKLVLLAGIAIGLGMVMVQTLREKAQPAPELATPSFDGSVHPMLDAVAIAVLQQEMPKAVMPVLCISVDRAPATRRVMESLSSPERMTVPSSHCKRQADVERGTYHGSSGQDAEILEVAAFRPTAPDAGTVEYSAYHHRMWASYKTLQVRRVDGVWKVVKVLKHVST